MSLPSRSITWVQIGDLHADEADGFASIDRLAAIVGEVNAMGPSVDWVFLPGDNANHGTAAQYARIVATLGDLAAPWRTIPGDHDYEPADLAAYEAAIPETNRPEVEVIGGHRCLFLDIVSAGSGGPDFRLTMHQRRRLAEDLARAAAEDTPPLVFLHAFPGDLAADGDEIARTLADARVAFVGTGHTHYNELLNDGRVLYGATRSTGQIEEGAPGYSVVSVHDGVVSWHFRALAAPGPMVRILAPSDRRLVTRPADVRQVPRPGPVVIVAQVLGEADEPPTLAVDDGAPMAMRADGAVWSAAPTLAEGLRRVNVTCGGSSDTIELLVRPASKIPVQGPPLALGCDVHSVGAWPERGLLGSKLGPNRNGGEPS